MKTDIDKLIDAETGYIDTNVDNDDAMRIILIPKYRVEWDYRENAEPEIEYFNSYVDAIADADEPGNFDLVDKYYEPVKRVKIFFDKGYLDEDENVHIDEEDISFDDIDKDLIPEYVSNLIQGLDGEIYSVEYPNPDDAYGLLNDVYDTINDDIINEYDDFVIEVPFKGKYRDICIYKDDDLAGVIQLRIADHSYNPVNNDTDAHAGKFISVEIFPRGGNSRGFIGEYSLQFFDGDSSYEDVIDAVNERIKHIIENEFEE